MKIGVPGGLLYHKYHVFIRTFLEELGAELVVSPDTNKRLLDAGVQYCVDEACLPIKVFHGHVSWLKDKCDAIFLPRFISPRQKEYICPMFCGLNEMLSNNISGLPALIDAPIYSLDTRYLSKWAQRAGKIVTADKKTIRLAFHAALNKHLRSEQGFNEKGYPLKIGLIGHAYNLYDQFVNMDIKKKLNEAGVGIMTSEAVNRLDIDNAVKELFKKPFWTFARDYYGAAVTMQKTGKIDGIIYLSSFSCGIDSVVTELIKNELDEFPFMVLKLDEHTGQAGFDTRLEAFSDLLKRRKKVGSDFSEYGKYRFGCGDALSGA